MTQQFKLGYRSLIFYALPVLLSGVSAIAVYTTATQVIRLSKAIQLEQATAKTLNEMIYGLSRMTRNVRGQALFPQDSSYLKSYEEGRSTFQQKATSLKSLVQEPQQQQRLLNIIAEGEKHDQISQKVFELIRKNQTQAAIAQVPLIRMNVVDRNYQDFSDHQGKVLTAYSHELESSLFSLKILVFISTLLGVIFASIIGFLITKRFRQAYQIEQQSQEIYQKNQQLQQTQSELIDSFKELEKAQSQLVQAEKMSSLGQLVAGIAHEINNPVNFIHGNLSHIDEYTQNLLELIDCYQVSYPNPLPDVQVAIEESELDFLQEDLPKILDSMKLGTERIRHIVLSLRNFSRMDESEFKAVDIHQGLDSTLLILQHRLKAKSERPEIQVIREYENLPLVECYAGQLNQVFMNILSNAIDALEELSSQRSPQENKENPGRLTIRTAILDAALVQVTIADNGIGMSELVRKHIFDPFFTTKPIGKGTGIGMAISYQIITEKHHGSLECYSTEGQGTEFVIQIPKQQNFIKTN